MVKRIRTSGGQAGDTTVIVQPAGDTDYTSDVGDDTHDIDKVGIVFGAQSVGEETSSVPSDELTYALSTPVGNDSVSDEATQVTQSLTMDMGDDDGALQDGFTLVFGAQELGETDESMTASSVTEVADYVDTATATNTNGTWANPTNAQGVSDGSTANAEVVAAPALATIDVDLEMDFGAVTVPYGTRSAVSLRIRHLLDTTMALTSSANASLVLSKSNGTSPLTLITSIRAVTSPIGDSNVRNDSSVADEEFDVTSHVSGWSEAELASALLVAHLDGTAIIAGGNARWFIDGAALLRSYTVTGIT